MGLRKGTMTAASYHLERKNRSVILSAVREGLEEQKFEELAHPGPGNLRSAGWVNFVSIFKADDLVMEVGEFLIFLYRIDEVKVSKSQAKLEAQKRISAAMEDKGDRLTKLEKQDIYEDVIADRARGTRPTIKLVEVAWDTLHNRLYVFDTAHAVREEICTHLAPILGTTPVDDCPYVVAQRAMGKERADEIIELEGLDPESSNIRRREVSRAWWPQFLLWMAYQLRDDQEYLVVGGENIEVYFEDKAVFASLYDSSLITIQCDNPFSCPVGAAALKEERVPVTVKMTMLKEVDKFPRRWKFLFDSGKGLVTAVKVPKLALDEFTEIIEERLTSLTALHNTLQVILGKFLELKADEDEWAAHEGRIKQWLDIPKD